MDACLLKAVTLIAVTPKFQLIKDQNLHHIKTSRLISSANQLTGFYKIVTLTFNGSSIILFNPFWTNALFLYPQKTSENPSLEYRSRTLVENGLRTALPVEIHLMPLLLTIQQVDLLLLLITLKMIRFDVAV